MSVFGFGQRLFLFVKRSLAIVVLLFSGIAATSVHAQSSSAFLQPGNQVYPSSIPTNTDSPSYLVNPNGPNNFFYGGWTTDQNGNPVGGSVPSGLVVDSDALQGEGFYQRTIRDSSTGENYIQLIILSDAAPGEGFGEVGMFTESYVKMGGGNGISVLQGMHCTPGTGKCPAPEGSTYPGVQRSVGFDALSKIRTGDFEDPREKFRFTQLIYDTDDPSKWADFDRGTSGTTFYSDIWGASYNYVDSSNDIELGDFTNTVTKTLDVNHIYSYATLTAEMQFRLDARDKEIAESMGILPSDLREESGFEEVNTLYSRISVLSEAEKLFQSLPGKFDTLDEAADYIEDFIQYRVIAQQGWREQTDAGLELHDMHQETFQGAVVKAGNVVYRQEFQGETITASWEDGDRVDFYGLDQIVTDVIRFGHEQVAPDTCESKPQPEHNQCAQVVRYQFEVTDNNGGPSLFSEVNYDPRVGDQFLIEDSDQVNPFDPFSTQAHLP